MRLPDTLDELVKDMNRLDADIQTLRTDAESTTPEVVRRALRSEADRMEEVQNDMRRAYQEQAEKAWKWDGSEDELPPENDPGTDTEDHQDDAADGESPVQTSSND